MEKKKKQSGAGLIAILFAGAAKMILKQDSPEKWLNLLYFLIMAALIYGAYRLLIKKANRMEKTDSELPERSPMPEERPSSSPSPKISQTDSETLKRFPSRNNESEIKEQLKSLYQSGLISREEYKEKLDRISGRG